MKVRKYLEGNKRRTQLVYVGWSALVCVATVSFVPVFIE